MSGKSSDRGSLCDRDVSAPFKQKDNLDISVKTPTNAKKFNFKNVYNIKLDDIENSERSKSPMTKEVDL